VQRRQTIFSSATFSQTKVFKHSYPDSKEYSKVGPNYRLHNMPFVSSNLALGTSTSFWNKSAKKLQRTLER